MANKKIQDLNGGTPTASIVDDTYWLAGVKDPTGTPVDIPVPVSLFGGGGGLWENVIAPITANNDSQIDLESDFSNYDRVEIHFTDVNLSVLAQLRARLKISGVYVTTASYKYGIHLTITNGTHSHSYSNTSTQISINREDTQNASGVIWLPNPTTTNSKKRGGGITYQDVGTSIGDYAVSFMINDVNPVGGVRIFTTTGVITSGYFRVIGLKKVV